MDKFNCSIDELKNRDELTDEQKVYLQWLDIKGPFGMGPCAMNQLCWYVESQMNGYKINLKRSSDFDYNFLKKKRRCTNEHREKLAQLCNLYSQMVKTYKEQKVKKDPLFETVYIEDKEEEINSRIALKNYFYNKAKELCPDDDERLNIVLDLCYQYRNNMQFCWDVIGELICARLEELKNEENNNE